MHSPGGNSFSDNPGFFRLVEADTGPFIGQPGYLGQIARMSGNADKQKENGTAALSPTVPSRWALQPGRNVQSPWLRCLACHLGPGPRM